MIQEFYVIKETLLFLFSEFDADCYLLGSTLHKFESALEEQKKPTKAIVLGDALPNIGK